MIGTKRGREVSRKEHEMAAYYHWEKRGCPLNDSMADWLWAEKRKMPTVKKKGWFFNIDPERLLIRIFE